MGINVGGFVDEIKSVLPSPVLNIIDSTLDVVKRLMMVKIKINDIIPLISELGKKGNAEGYNFSGNRTKFDAEKCDKDNLVIFLNEADLAIGIYVQNEYLAQFLKTKTRLPVYTSTEKINPQFIVTQKFGKVPLSNEQVGKIRGEIDNFFRFQNLERLNQTVLMHTKNYFYEQLQVPTVDDFSYQYRRFKFVSKLECGSSLG